MALKRRRSKINAHKKDGPRKFVKTCKKTVSLDNLKWKPVEISGKLDDMEGFYGLEEVEGVDVELNNGKLKFKASESSNDESYMGNIQKEVEQESSDKSSGNESLDEQENDTPFCGFDDDSQVSGSKNSLAYRNKNRFPVMATKDQSNPFDLLQKADENIDTGALDWDLKGTRLSEEIYRGLAKLKFTKPTEIQSLAIPEIIAGNDVIGKAATGSGKTLAYGIPILEHYLSRTINTKWPSGLIFAPTRELAVQITKHLEEISKYITFGSSQGIVSITGGLAVQKQKRLLGANPAIVVATPGRFLDLLNSQEGNELVELFQKTETLVLDEADRLIQDGHFQAFEDILDLIGRGKKVGRQTLVFSATFQRELMQKLDKKKKKNKNNNNKKSQQQVVNTRFATNGDVIENLKHKLQFKSKDPIFIDANPAEALASQVVETIMECGATEKDLYLYYFLVAYPDRSIVFVNSIETVKRLVPFLKELEIPCFGLHSDMIQKQRLRSLEKFKENDSGVLVATDVAARGLDISLVQHVIHYHLPRSADMYVHRSGRTARAGNKGISLVICSPEEASGPLIKLKRLLYTENATYQGSMHTFDINYALLSSLKRRVTLARQISEFIIESTHKGKKNAWVKQAAEDLGLDIDEDELEKLVNDKKKKKKHNITASNLVATEKSTQSSLDLKRLRAELKNELEKSVGFGSKYLTGGDVNIAQLILSGKSHDTFVGLKKESALSMVGN